MYYSVKLKSGLDVPPGIVYDPLTRTLTFIDDGSLTAGSMALIITG
jgi:hypothetical protein